MDRQARARRPYTFVVMGLLIAILGGASIVTMPADIFPYIDLPVVSVVWQYNGLSPEEMETRIVTNFERALTANVVGFEHIESQSHQSVSAVRVYFHPTLRWIFERLRYRYMGLLDWSLDHRMPMLLGFVLVALGSLWLARRSSSGRMVPNSRLFNRMGSCTSRRSRSGETMAIASRAFRAWSKGQRLSPYPVMSPVRAPGLFLSRATLRASKNTSLGNGSERIDLYYFGPGHTNGDAWVVFPSLRTLHAGDIFASANDDDVG